jgi:hypothetical protein
LYQQILSLQKFFAITPVKPLDGVTVNGVSAYFVPVNQQQALRNQ